MTSKKSKVTAHFWWQSKSRCETIGNDVYNSGSVSIPNQAQTLCIQLSPDRINTSKWNSSNDHFNLQFNQILKIRRVYWKVFNPISKCAIRSLYFVYKLRSVQLPFPQNTKKTGKLIVTCTYREYCAQTAHKPKE